MKIYEDKSQAPCSIEIRPEKQVCYLISSSCEDEVIVEINKKQIPELIKYLQLADQVLEPVDVEK